MEKQKKTGRLSRSSSNQEANGAASKEAESPSGSYPEWKPHLSSYREKMLLKFESEQDLEAAIDLLWSAPFRTLPHDTPDGKSLIIPAEAVIYFSQAGLKFKSGRLQTISDLSPGEIRQLRR